MDILSLLDSIVYQPFTTPEEEGVPVEFETKSGDCSHCGCVIA